MTSETTTKPVRSPCIGVCDLDHRNLCNACLRTLDEIARWRQMDDPQKRQVLDNIELRRQATNKNATQTITAPILEPS